MIFLVLLYHYHNVAILSLTLLSTAMITFFILSKRIRLKHKGLSDAIVASLIQKEYNFAVHFL